MRELFLGGWFRFYCKTVLIFFILLIGGTFCFGRALSVQKLFIVSGLPFYITDVFILFALPLVVMGSISLVRTPALFRYPFWILLVMGCSYLGWGLFVERDMFAVRNVTLSAYLLFLPLVWRIFDSMKRLEWFLVFFVICNIASITLNYHPTMKDQAIWMAFIAHTKSFNLALCYGITLAFLLAYEWELAKGWRKFLVWLLCSLNLTMIIFYGVRSAWVAIFCLSVFYIYLFRSKWKQVLITYLFIFVSVSGLLYFMDHRIAEIGKKVNYVDRIAGTKMFIDQKILLVKDAGVDSAGPKEEAVVTAVPPTTGNAPKLVKEAVVTAGALESCANINWRLEIWGETWREGMKSPVWGHGFSKVLQYKSTQTLPIRGFVEDSGLTPPHNAFLTIFYRMGFVGLVLFLWVNGFVFVRGMQELSSCKTKVHRVCLAGLLGSFVVWHVMAQSFDLIDSPPTNIFLWMIMGFILVLVYKKETHFSQGTTINP